VNLARNFFYDTMSHETPVSRKQHNLAQLDRVPGQGFNDQRIARPDGGQHAAPSGRQMQSLLRAQHLGG